LKIELFYFNDDHNPFYFKVYIIRFHESYWWIGWRVYFELRISK